MLEIGGYTTEIARTVLYARLVQDLAQLLVEEERIPFLALFYHYVHIADPWHLKSPRSIGG